MRSFYDNMSTEALARMWIEKQLEAMDISKLIYSRPDGKAVMKRVIQILESPKLNK